MQLLLPTETYKKTKVKSLIPIGCNQCLTIFHRRKERIEDQLRELGPNTKSFCSKECRTQWQSRNKIATKCSVCGTLIFRARCDLRATGNTLCSRKCVKEWASKLRPKQKRTPQQKTHLSNWAKGNPRGFALNPAYYGSLGGSMKRINGKLVLREKKRGMSICQECTRTFERPAYDIKRKYCSVVCANKNRYHPNSTRVHRSLYQNQQMDSGAELAFAQLLDTHQIHWVKNRNIYFNYIDPTGKSHKYYPDFYLPEYDWWIEIKGAKYKHPWDQIKLAAVGRIELISSDKLQLPSIVKPGHAGFAPAAFRSTGGCSSLLS